MSKPNDTNAAPVHPDGSTAWHGCMLHAMEEAAAGIEDWEYGGAETAEEFRMTRLAAMEVARRIRSMASRYSRKFER